MGIARIGMRAMFVILVTTIAVSAFIIRDVVPGQTFATNGINLKIDSRAFYNGFSVPSSSWALKDLTPGVHKFFNFNDIKPGDSGKTNISMHAQNQSAWLCLDFKNFEDLDNGQNEPESTTDANGNVLGELGEGLEFFSWLDDGDNVFEVGEKPLFGTSTQAGSSVLNGKTYAIGDTRSGSACGINDTCYVGIAWCAGNLAVNLATAAISCDGDALGNAAQTDNMSVDISIRAMPSSQNSQFSCTNTGGGNPPPNPPPTPPHRPPTPPHRPPQMQWHPTPNVQPERPERPEHRSASSTALVSNSLKHSNKT